MELTNLSLIKPMFMRSLSNPEALKFFINYLIGIMGLIFWIVICILVVHFIYSLIYSIKKSSKKEQEKEQNLNKSIFKETLLQKIKSNLRNYRYFFIWFLMLFLSRLIISIVYWLIDSWETISCNFSPEENYLLWVWAIYSLYIFIIASIFIMFCFGNKFVRNLWIFILIICFWFILMGKFISLRCIWM